MVSRTLVSFIPFVVAGALLGGAFLFPGAIEGAVLNILAITFFTFLSERSAIPARGLFVAGYVAAVLAHYWVPQTIHSFGGFSISLSALFYTLFAAVWALQFLLVGVLVKKIRGERLDDYGLSFAIAFTVVDLFYPKLFPWNFSHPFLPITPVSALAEYLGGDLLGFLVLWWGGLTVRLMELPAGVKRLALVVPVVFGVPLFVGALADSRAQSAEQLAPEIRVGIVQGNLEAEKKRDVLELSANLAVYQRLSTEVVAQGAELVLWPESILSRWVPENISSLREGGFDPWPNRKVPLLFGGLTFRLKTDQEFRQVQHLARGRSVEEAEALRYGRFNSTIISGGDGSVTGIYNKQVLMPFGEYLPFERTLPFLRTLSPLSGDFDFGSRTQPIGFEIAGKSLSVMPLVCYEDIVPGPARVGVQQGASVLINTANDAWYGDTVAPRQHNLLASFRAIETRRYLARVTNTGTSSVINSRGESVHVLPGFSPQAIVAPLKILRGETFYVKYGDQGKYLLILGILWPIFRGQRSRFAEGTSSLKLRIVE